jgi:hypothetical protein
LAYPYCCTTILETRACSYGRRANVDPGFGSELLARCRFDGLYSVHFVSASNPLCLPLAKNNPSRSSFLCQNNMKTEAAVTTLSESGDSVIDVSLQDGGVILIPKPSDDPRDPLVCASQFGPEQVHTNFYVLRMYCTNCLTTSELGFSKEGYYSCCSICGALRRICCSILWPA